MIASFYHYGDQKQLYFKLNNLFGLEDDKANMAGIYAIYKDDICLYVGQSKNIASRISTHMCGKYEKATHFYCIDVRDIGFNDFFSRDSEAKESILLNCELSLIQILKPIDNIIADYTKKISEEKAPDLIDNDMVSASFVVKKDINNFTVCNSHNLLVAVDIDFIAESKYQNKTIGGIEDAFLSLHIDSRIKLDSGDLK